MWCRNCGRADCIGACRRPTVDRLTRERDLALRGELLALLASEGWAPTGANTELVMRVARAAYALGAVQVETLTRERNEQAAEARRLRDHGSYTKLVERFRELQAQLETVTRERNEARFEASGRGVAMDAAYAEGRRKGLEETRGLLAHAAYCAGNDRLACDGCVEVFAALAAQQGKEPNGR